MSLGLHRPKQSNISPSLLWPPPLSSYSTCSFPLLSLSGRHISSLNAMERRIDSYGTGVYTILADSLGESQPNKAQSCQPWWISCQPRGRAEKQRNKPLSPALCHVFVTLLVSKFPLQNQPVSRLLTKTILYILHPLYSYLSIHFLIFLFILAMNWVFLGY